jgi:flagellar motor switch protein FliN/FliY
VTPTERDTNRTLLDELSRVVGVLGGGDAAQEPGTAPNGTLWTVTIATEDTSRLVWMLAVDHDGAASLATAMVGRDDDVAIEGVLRDAVAKALAGIAADDQAAGMTVMAVSKGDVAPAGPLLATASLSAAGLQSPLQVGQYAVVPLGGGRGRQVSRASSAEQQQARLDVILDIDLPVVVRFGRTEMPLRAVTRIAPGSVIDLGRSPDDPVELLVSDRVVARGEVVVVGGNYGIRIVDVVSPSERVRSMEG